MLVRFYAFAKDRNSTKQPGAVAAYALDCNIFEPCSIIAPSFIIAGDDANAIYKSSSYVYVPTWGRYYWITDKKFIDSRYIISCDIDVLATYKTQIGASYQFVIRSASKSNEYITDNAYPMSGEVKTLIKYNDGWDSPFQSELADGMFVVGIVGSNNSADVNFGAVNYYGFSASEFVTFLNALMSNQNDWMSVATSDLSDSTTKMILNPMQYITTCYWMPFSYTYGTASTATIKFGWWDITGIAHRVLPATGGMPAISGDINFITTSLRHPQAATRGAYLNRQPYSEVNLYIPQLGYIPIPGDIYALTKTISVNYYVDYATSEATFDIKAYEKADYTGTGYDITRTSAKIGIDVPIAQIAVDTIGFAQSGVSMISNAFQSGLVGSITGVVRSIINGGVDMALKASTPIPNIMAAAGSLSGYMLAPQLFMKCNYITNDATPLIGKPLCDYVQISTLSGYVQCATNHIEIPTATAEELDRIENFFTAGFRYE